MHGNRSCEPMHVTEAFLKKYKLPMVKISAGKEYTSLGELIQLLKLLFKQVAESTIEEEAEGVVLYFEAELDGKREILSLCKLKTLEYRLYRKMREKLKTMIAKGKQVAEQMGSYKKESEKLCRGYETPKPLAYYFEVAEIAFRFIAANMSIARSLGLTNRFLDFLNVIRSCKEKGVEPKADHFKKILEAKNTLSDDSDLGDEGKDEEDEKPRDKSRRTSEEEEQKITTHGQGEKSKNKRKSRKGTEESVEDGEEECKLDKTKQTVKNYDGKAFQQLVIITPPLYLDGGLIPKIQEKVGVKEIKTKWPQENSTSQGRSVVLMHEFPEILSDEEIKDTTVFLVAGFTKDVQKSTLKKLGSLTGLGREELTSFSNAEISFIESSDKQKLLESLWMDYERFSKEVLQTLPKNYQELQLTKADKIITEVEFALEKLDKLQVNIREQTNEKESKIEKKGRGSKKNVLVFIFVGLPGMGKTRYVISLTKLLEEKDCGVTTICSDKVRRALMDEFLERNPKANHQHAFDKSSRHAKTRFFENVEQVLDKVNSYSQDTHAIILDKNHPPNIIQDTIQFFHKLKFKTRFNIKTVIVTPHCVNSFITDDNHYPFSLSFLLKCIQRATARTEHETLVGDARKMAVVLIGFFNMYRGFKFTEANFLVMGADLHVSLPFTKEEEEQEKMIHKALAKPLDKLVHRLRGFDADQDKLTAFIDTMNTIEVDLKDPETELVHQTSLENVESA